MFRVRTQTADYTSHNYAACIRKICSPDLFSASVIRVFAELRH